MKNKKTSFFLSLGITCIVIITSCSLFMAGENNTANGVAVTSLKLQKSSVSLGVGGMEYLSLTINPSNATEKISYSCNVEGIVSIDGDRNGVTLTGLKAGNTVVKAISESGFSAACVVSVTGIDSSLENSPQITSSTIALELEQGISKRVQVALKGGSAADMSAFQWSIDKSTIASIEGSGQTAYITAKSNGIAQVTVTHPLATYPYQFCVFVKPENEQAIYITNTQNILTIDRNAGSFSTSVDLIGGETGDEAFFSWEVISSAESDSSCISIVSNGKNCVIEPLKAGESIIQVNHPKASYPYSIRCKIVTIVENIIIEPSTTKIRLNGLTPTTVTAKLTGFNDIYDVNEFVWSTENEELLELTPFQDSCGVRGLANGIGKVKISHPIAKYSREIMVFIENHPAGSVDGGMYITTDQNYIRTKVGNINTLLKVSLIGGVSGDESDFVWSVDDSSIINLETVHGIVSNARSVYNTRQEAQAIITPCSEGTAIISVSHPKVVVPIEIMVKVYSEDTLLEEPLFISGPDILPLLVGESKDISLSLSGNVVTGDEANLSWSCEDSSVISLTAANGTSASVMANSVGESWITISHPKAESKKKILVYTAETEEELATKKIIYTTKNYYTLVANGSPDKLKVLMNGFDSTSIEQIEWSVKDLSICSISIGADNSECIVGGLSEGKTTITASHPDCSKTIEFIINVYEGKSTVSSSNNKPLFISGPDILPLLVGESKDISLSLSGNVVTGDEANLSWSCEDSSVVSLTAANGTSASVMANSVGESWIMISHPKAESEKKILVYTAETEEELATKKIIYTTKSYYTLVANGTSDRLKIITNGFDVGDIQNISWQNSNPYVAKFSLGADNSECIVSGLSEGSTIITASHPDCSKTVEFIIDVYETVTDIGVIDSPIYFTTTQNVVQFTELNTSKGISITPVKLSSSKYSQIQWQVEDENICEVISNGSKATITSLAEGVSKIYVSHPDSENILEITVRVGNQYVVPVVKSPYIYTSQDVLGLVNGAGGEKISAFLTNIDGNSQDFVWSIDDTEIATISPLGDSCYVVPKNPGQALLTVSHPNAQGMDCQVLILVANSEEELAELTYLTTSQNVISLRKGSQQSVQVRIVNGNNPLASEYLWQAVSNSSIVQIIASGNQAVIKGLSSGVAKINVSHSDCKYPLEITVEIKEDVADASLFPYITNNQNIVTLTQGSSAKSINVTLAGGTVEDYPNFSWSFDRADIISMVANGQNAVIKGLSPGECLITVIHPKAQYPYNIKVIVNEAVESSSLYIKTSPANIITMKPADPEQTVTASLVGGTAEDVYGFKWYADNYNVIDLTATANTAVITPRAEGTATITIEHPKAAFPGELTVRVTEYSTFEFSMTNITMTEGNTQFISMKVPSIETEYGGRVVYKTDNEKIVTITGTNKVAQLTAVASGTAIVTATSPSGAVSEMMVYVKKASEQVLPYITSGTNVLSMKSTDGQRAVSAQLVGQDVVTTDQYNLQWSIDDVSVAKLIGTSGSSVFIQPIGPGETTLRISHEKTDSIYTMHIYVTGTEGGISINKTYVALETGKSVEISATIDNGTSSDYSNITWYADKVDGKEILTVLGSGKTVALYGLASGQTTLTAEWNGNTAKCDVLVEASRQFAFDTQSMRVQPGQTKTFKYTLVPEDAEIQWFTSTNDYIAYSVDPATKTVSVTGISENTSGGASITTLSAISQSMKASLSVTTSWDYKFTLGKTMIKAEPQYDSLNPDKFVIPYTVNPSDAEINVSLTNDIADVSVDTSNKQIILSPTSEGEATLIVTAKNATTGETFPNMQRTCSLVFKYNSLSITPKIVQQWGSFSELVSGGFTAFYIGDGETVEFAFDIEEPNSSCEITSISLEAVDATTNKIQLEDGASGSTKKLRYLDTTTEANEYIEYQYYIPKWYDVYGRVKEVCSDSCDSDCTDTHYGEWFLLEPEDFKEYDYWFNWDEENEYGSYHKILSRTIMTMSYNKNSGSTPNNSLKKNYYYTEDENTDGYETYLRKRNTSRDGAYLSKKEFESSFLYFMPYRNRGKAWQGNSPNYGRADVIYLAQQSGILPAEEIPVFDTTIVSSEHTANLHIKTNHAGCSELIIPVYTVIRPCVYNYQK